MSTIKCINGHEESDSTALHLKCSTCGAALQYKDPCLQQLKTLPKVELTFEKVSMVFVGVPTPPGSALAEDKDVFTSSILLGENEMEKVESFTLRRADATSWLDFYSKYLSKLGRWMKFIGLDRSHYRFLIVDTRKSLSVLALAAIQQSWKNTIVLAITADQTSTLIEQNTSFVAIGTALKQGLPVIAVSTSYVEELIFYTERGGLVVRAQALIPILSLLVSGVDSVMDMMGNDSRLGIKEHCLSAILSASEKVYPSVENALSAQESSFSIEAKKADVVTACLLAFAPIDIRNRIEKAFAKYRRQDLKDAISADHEGYPRDGGATLFSSSLYDLLMIYGLKEGLTYESLKKGYDSIASKVPELSLEKVV